MEYKAPAYGTKLDMVDRWYPSSKMCRNCGHKHDGLKLSDRIFVCPICTPIKDRDLQAAINLAKAPDDICSRVGSIRT
ncbi:zinc ribbon domain-containing protein [Scytonema sp. PRP1]|uniref:zinc ribbon domain-containing protein n=1 Tax=Scytonema sp. PRP1 TaxID=3120513 RepID=UPI002FD648DD